MIRLTRRLALAAAFGTMLAIVGTLSGCGYNDFQRLDEAVKASWSEVLNQYQRRADLIPNIVATVKGEANFEQETLTRVVEARAKATSIQVTPETLNNPEAFNRFQQAQGELSGALSRLMAVPGLPPSHGASLGALASATAIIVAPAALAALSGSIDLRLAFLVPIPLLLTLVLLHGRPVRTPREPVFFDAEA